MRFDPDPVTETRPTGRPSARLRFGVAFLVGLLITLGLGAGAMYAYDQQYTGRVLPGVRVGGVDLSGLSPDQARATLDGAYGAMTDGRIVLTGPDGKTVITYAEIGRRLDTEALVDEAVAVGRDGTAIDRVVANARTAVRGVDLAPRVTFDAKVLADRINAVAAGLRVEPAEASVKATEALEFEVVAGHPGRVVDASEVAQSIAAQLAALDAPAEVTATLPVEVIEPDVTTAEATQAEAVAERIAADITLVVGSKKTPIDTKKLRPWISFTKTADGSYAPVIDTTDLPTLLKGLAKKINRKAVNASFTTSGSRITGVTPSKDGYKLDTAATAKQIEALLATRALGTDAKEITPALAITKPALTTAEAKAARPKMRMISRWTTQFQVYERNNFGANIWIPALTINGYVVGPGETFDFWNAVGTVSRAKGYGLGGAIINGRTEPQGALAGGICSCSTTLFNAALRAGLDMGARRNHYYYIDRYPIGLEKRLRIQPDDVVRQRHGLPGAHPRRQDPERIHGLRPVRDLQRSDGPQGHHQPADHQERSSGDRYRAVHVIPSPRDLEAHRVSRRRQAGVANRHGEGLQGQGPP
jgi:vancomycin resistance protein YoaR